MGVHGLWRLIEPSGKPVPLETLENKVLAVDISIWLHQAIKGFQDSKGASVPNAHLLGIYHRMCKLLYFKIKPVIVFDGGVPALKKQTIAKRNQSKLRNQSEADKIQKQLLSTLLKHSAVSKVLTEKIEASIATLPKAPKPQKEDMYVLPAANTDPDSTISSSEDESLSTETDSSPTKNWDLHTIDMKSKNFKSLPVDVRHEILTDLKETRKQNSWGRLHELPAVSDDFSVYQMKRLLKRQAVQAALEEVEKEMGGKSLSLAELESILKDQGVIKNSEVGNRIASDDTTKYLLVKDIKKAIEEARLKEKAINDEVNSIIIDEEATTSKPTIAEQEYEDDLQRAIALSLECEPSTSSSQNSKKTNPAEFSFLENFSNADFASSSSEDEETFVETSKNKKLSSVESYMLEYSGLTPSEIAKILNANGELKKGKLKKSGLATVSNDSVGVTSKNTGNINESLAKIDDLVEVTSNNDDIGSEIETRNINESLAEVEEIDDSADTDIESAKITENINESPAKLDDLVEVLSNSDADDTGAEINTRNINESLAEIDNSVDTDIKSANESHEESTNITETSDALVEIMSNSDSSDSESEKKTINIVINPNTQIEDDLFADIFAPKPNLEIVMNPKTDFQKQDDIFEAKTEENFEATKEINKDTTKTTPALSEAQLKDLKDQLQQEKVDLLNEKSTKERLAGNITDQMYQEAQELLELFGVPYIIAPMEAEAQCAFLDAIELTDGTITDDSDIWLFGGKTVYKNFFNQSKYVMEFRAENIQHNFKLTREQMILLALLVGSDYTVGLQGVGPVTAMEILAAFPGKKVQEFNLMHSELLSGLKEFRSWFTKGKSPGPGRSSLKSKLTNLIFTENFPSQQVVQAYLDPTVETSKEAFSWGKPNFGALLEYAREKFGWTRTKTEEIINPVLKKLEESSKQKSIKDYFKSRFKVHSTSVDGKMSKRVKTAINNMGRDPSEILAEEIEGELKQTKKRQARKKKNTEAPEFSKNSAGNDEDKTSRQSKVNLEKLKSTSEEIAAGVETRRRKIDEGVEIKKPQLSKKKKLANDDDATESGKQIRQKRKTDAAETKRSKKEKLPTEEFDNKNPVDDVTEKINKIRQRRKVNEAKAAVEVKKPKEKKLLEIIPEELKKDKEVKLLPKIVAQSSEKVEEINKNMIEKLRAIQDSKPSTSTSSPRPTRVPKKETIPQKEKDKSTILRNKLKAIEIFRKGKQGPGFVQKRGRNRKLPKADAGLSESSDDE